MAPIYVLDRFYLLITFLITVGFQLLGFYIAWTFQFDKVTDFTGGSNFFILALITLLIGGTFHARNIVASVFVMVWAVRIAGFLLFRVLKRGSDRRFDEIRSHFWKFLGFWIGQIVWNGTPTIAYHIPTMWYSRMNANYERMILTSPRFPDRSGSNPRFGTSRDIAGIVIWTLGFLVESVADAQKYQRKATKAIPQNRPMDKGLWAWSRHPPYFGEIMCWWGIWILCLSPATNGTLPSSTRAALYGSVVSPVFTVLLLMFVSGLPTAEKPQAKKFYMISAQSSGSSSSPVADGQDNVQGNRTAWTEYKAYLDRTSILIPIPPVIYKPIPRVIKKTLLLDFPVYEFREEKDGLAAEAEAARGL